MLLNYVLSSCVFKRYCIAKAVLHHEYVGVSQEIRQKNVLNKPVACIFALILTGCCILGCFLTMSDFIKITVKINIQLSQKSPFRPLLSWPVLTESTTTDRMSFYTFSVFSADMLLIWLAIQPRAANPSTAIQTEPVTYHHGHWSKACT